jgi:cell division protein FtsI (penicillin-binding protein 3)
MTTLAPPPRGSARRDYVDPEDHRDFVDYDEPVRRPRRAPRIQPPRVFTPGDPSVRIRVWQIISLILLSVVAARVIDLQVIQGPALAAKALLNATITKDLPAQRGVISDRNGVPLAVTVDAVNVTADQTLVAPKAKSPEEKGAAQRLAARKLASVLGGDPLGYQQRLDGKRHFVYIKKGITPATWQKVLALNIPGIYSEPAKKRTYPAGSVAANVIGFVRADGQGGGGLEYGLDRELAGTSGSSVFQRGVLGQAIPTTTSTGTDPIPGTNVTLTIDRDVQWVAQKAIAERVKFARADSGTVVVMNPRTGQIYALATVPTFDPNKPAEAVQANVGNRALSQVFEPGSTSKIMTLAAVIEEGKATALTQLTIPPTLIRPWKTFHDHDKHGVEHLTLNGVLAKSSNIGTILAAEKIGGPKLYSYLKKFGIGSPTGLQFPGESRGHIPAPADWSKTSFGTIAFGQGLSLNAVQAASIFATIANDGVRVSLTLIAGSTGSDGRYHAAAAPTSSRVVRVATARAVRSMLESVVSDEGTAPMAAIPGYRVAGKTGTADRPNPDPKPNAPSYKGFTSSFIGFAPADNPSIVVAVILDNPRNGHYGGVLAGPVFKSVMTYSLEHFRIPPTGAARPHIPVTW